jgi:hypothetical protein
MNDRSPAMISARPLELRSIVANCLEDADGAGRASALAAVTCRPVRGPASVAEGDLDSAMRSGEV